MSLVKLLNDSLDLAQKPGKIYGVVTGVVRDVKDPDRLGRVKVDFPWLGEASEAVSISSTEDRAHSYWARIATIMAGKEYGTYFIPEKGDEVLVAFEFGDPDRPFVLGSIWNADDRPPENMDGNGKNNIRSIRSRSGHIITLNDSDDKPSISIIDNTGNNSIVIDSANNAMQIKAKGDLTIEVGGNISIKADGKMETITSQDLSFQTQTNLQAKARNSAEIKADAGLKLESGAQTEVKGMTLSISGSSMTEIKGGLVTIN